jgi:tetratricopeptide (TPR) repeat protein
LEKDALRKRALLEKVDKLYSRLLLKESVLREVRMDAWLSKADRRFALQVARHFAENPLQLNNAAWQIVRAAGGTNEANALALRQAEAAVQAAPGHGPYLNTLGVAHYRMGNYGKALQTLTQSEKLNAKQRGIQPADLAFLAMAQHQLAKIDEAKAALVRLREVMRQERWAKDAEAQGFLREAEVLIEGKPAEKKE